MNISESATDILGPKFFCCDKPLWIDRILGHVPVHKNHWTWYLISYNFKEWPPLSIFLENWITFSLWSHMVTLHNLAFDKCSGMGANSIAFIVLVLSSDLSNSPSLIMFVWKIPIGICKIKDHNKKITNFIINS